MGLAYGDPQRGWITTTSAEERIKFIVMMMGGASADIVDIYSTYVSVTL